MPRITYSCSHEHDGFFGTVSISSSTLSNIVRDIISSLKRTGIRGLIIVNAHGGNYVLNNGVQEKNLNDSTIVLLLARKHWNLAYKAAGLEVSREEDMHALLTLSL